MLKFAMPLYEAKYHEEDEWEGFDRRSSIGRRRGYDRRHNQDNRYLNAIERREPFRNI